MSTGLFLRNTANSSHREAFLPEGAMRSARRWLRPRLGLETPIARQSSMASTAAWAAASRGSRCGPALSREQSAGSGVGRVGAGSRDPGQGPEAESAGKQGATVRVHRELPGR